MAWRIEVIAAVSAAALALAGLEVLGLLVFVMSMVFLSLQPSEYERAVEYA